MALNESHTPTGATAKRLSSTTIKNYMGSADDSMQTVLHYIVPSDVIINYAKGFV